MADVVKLETEEEKKGPFRISLDTQSIVNHFNPLAKIGYIVTYQQANELIGRNTQTEARGCLKTALDIMAREKRLAYEAVENVGYKFLDDKEKVMSMEKRLDRIRSQAKKGRRVGLTIENFEPFLPEEKAKAMVANTLFMAFAKMTRKNEIKLLEGKCLVSGERLPLPDTFEHFRGKK